jgi:Zn-dependent peptidase ImmA (M78 family)
MFNPARLALARKRRGMTRIALARAIQMSVPIVHAYERGLRNPSGDALKTIADVLKFPVAFFEAGPVAELNVGAASFRATKSLRAADREAALAAGSIAVDLSRWIGERFELPQPTIPSLRGLRAEDAADALRSEWGLGQRPISNMVHLLEAHGVRVFSLPTDTLAVDAFSIWDGDIPFVFLTTHKSGERGRMDAAHELGHLALHRFGNQEEREAEQFASAFLMPKGTVLAAAPRNLTIAKLITLKDKWRVSAAAVLYRLHAVGLVTDWHYRTLWIQLSEQGYRREEPHGISRETSQLLNKVFSQLRSEGILRSAIARDISISNDELECLIFGLVISAVSGGRTEKSAGRSNASLAIVDKT